ncbi:MAG: DUF1858 domain-containing protein [Planctomycetota bacterium]
MADYSQEMIVADIVDAHPKAKDVLLEFGLPCSECIVAFHETLAVGVQPHGLDAEVIVARLREKAPLPQHPNRKKK